VTRIFLPTRFGSSSLGLALAAALPLALGACAAAALPALPGIAATAMQSAGAAAGYAGIQMGEKNADRHTPGSLEDQPERCDALVGAAPQIEEVRKNKEDVIEARQWRLVNPENPRWMIVTTKTGPVDGWEPKPRISKLQFSPPLIDQLDYEKTQFIAYAPNNLDSVDNSRAMTSITEAFGEPAGTFQWHGTTYGYTMVPRLPCFPTQK
jgi:hypothetical protein